MADAALQAPSPETPSRKGPRGPVIFEGERPRGWIAWSWLAIALSIAFMMGAGLAVYLAAAPFGVIELAERPGFLFFLVCVFGASALVTLVWAALVERRGFASLGLGARRAGPRFLVGAGAGFLMLTVVVAGMAALGGARVVSIGPALDDPVTLGWIGLILVGFVVQASTEELVFRGWMMSAIALRAGLIAAVAINSLVFAALHAGNVWPPDPIAMSNLALFGVFASLYALAERSIWGVCGWHATWNWGLMAGYEIEVSGMPPLVDALAVDVDAAGPSYLSGGAFGPEGSVITTFVLLGAIAFFAWRLKRAAEQGV